MHAIDPHPFKLNRPLCDLPSLCFQEVGDGLQGGALSSPVGPEEGDDRPLGNHERDPFQDQDNVLVDDLDIVHT